MTQSKAPAATQDRPLPGSTTSSLRGRAARPISYLFAASRRDLEIQQTFRCLTDHLEQRGRRLVHLPFFPKQPPATDQRGRVAKAAARSLTGLLQRIQNEGEPPDIGPYLTRNGRGHLCFPAFYHNSFYGTQITLLTDLVPLARDWCARSREPTALVCLAIGWPEDRLGPIIPCFDEVLLSGHDQTGYRDKIMALCKKEQVGCEVIYHGTAQRSATSRPARSPTPVHGTQGWLTAATGTERRSGPFSHSKIDGPTA